MSILVFGKTGQVAYELQRLHPEFTYLSRKEADLLNPDICAEAILAAKPSAVINAAAYTAVDLAEDEESLAYTINAEAPAAMAQACANLGIPFVHISIDYVFDGSGEMSRAPDAPTAPINAYGRTKLAGEEAIHSSGAPSVGWAEFAREIFAQANRSVTVTDIPTKDYPTPAARPLNSRLDCASLLSDFGVKQPQWKDELAKVISELT